MNTLVIVDVQKQFDKYIQYDLVDELSEYSEKFDKVYQIWDTHNGVVGPTHSFPKQVDSIPKKFGKKFFSKSVSEFINNIEEDTEEGTIFTLSGGEGYIVRVDNNHDWFYVNPEIVDLINKIKRHILKDTDILFIIRKIFDDYDEKNGVIQKVDYTLLHSISYFIFQIIIQSKCKVSAIPFIKKAK